jgi:ABC-type glycerol-3-phosphate transport system substrate-binding protein
VEENKLSYLPLYLQVRNVLMKRIVDGLHRPGDLIPSESKLAAEFGTSVSTVRQALSLLVADGVLSKKQGKGTSVSEKKVVLSFLSWIGETPRGSAILRELIERFEKKNPAISIHLVPTTFTDTKTELLRLITNGNAPDIAQIVSPWTTYFAAMGALAPLEEYLSAENLANRFPDKDLLGGTYNGKLFSVAWGLCPLSLIANKAVLREAGIDIAEVPLALDEFEEICRKISRQRADESLYAYGLNVRHDETDFLRVYTFLQAFGGEFVDDAEQVVFNCRENIEGFMWVKRLLETSRIYTGDIYSIRDRFARNEIAFMTDGPWIKYILEELTGQDFDANFRVILNPARKDRPSITWNYNHALAICSQSRYKHYAGLFIDQVTNDPDLSDFYFSTTGHLPSNRTRLDSPHFRGEFFQAFREQLAHAKCINARNSMFEKAMVLAMDAVKKILLENVDIEKELNEKEYYLNMLYYG